MRFIVSPSRRAVLWPVFAFAGAPLAPRAPRLALGSAFGFATGSAFGSALWHLAGQEIRLRESTRPGSPDRPGWMDIRLDDVATLAKHRLRLRPIVLKSLLGAGYQCLGDLRWVPGPQLTRLFYVGLKTARQIRTVVERLERDACISEE